MKNRDSRKEVENLLQWAFNVDDGKVLDTLAIKANEYNIAPSKVNRIWQSILSLESLTVDELCVFYSILCKFYKQKMPELTEFFTPTEIGDIEKLKHLQKDKQDETIVIENAFRLKENEWNTTMPMSLIVEIDNSNKLRYNRETQRPTILKMLGDGVDERNFLNKRQVREIAEKISTGEYHPDAITLNVLDDGNNRVTYNEMTHELYIDGMIDIPDGYHRNTAMHLARQANPDCEMYFPVTVTFLDIAGAQDLIAQRNKGTRIDMRYTKALENKASNTLVSDIIRDNNADRIYRTKIVKTVEELKAGAGLILFYELSDAIEEEYKLGKVAPKVRINDLREWIVEFMNELAGLMFNEWIPAKTRGKSWAGRHYAFPAYIMLSSMLKDRPDWKQLLPIIMSDIDYASININKTSTEKAVKSIKSIIKTKTEEVMNKHVL